MTTILAVLMTAFAPSPASASLCNLKPENAEEHSAALAKAAPPMIIPADDAENMAAPDSDLCRTREELDRYVNELSGHYKMDPNAVLSEKVRALYKILKVLVADYSTESPPPPFPDIFISGYKAKRKYLSSDEKSLIWGIKLGLAARNTPASSGIVVKASRKKF